MARKKTDVIEENIIENISIESLEDVMSSRYSTYAKYVIQDRAIPDVRDGLKPVQRRIIYAMYMAGDTINKPTKKCAHTVGSVMGKYHPHGDSSIYEALARMSQDWKVGAPLIDFQGNNGSIDGDSPAAYRYTEARLSELANEMVKDLDKDTVDMQLTFDDTAFEPTVLPSRFPNLLVNGSEGIAVALATEIPTHNLKEVIDAVIYRINHKNCLNEDLMNFILGPDFPTGGIIHNCEGLKNIYLTGKGKIDVLARARIEEKKDINQIIITEVPYKTVKINIVYEIDKIRHNRSIDGIIEVRDESDFSGIRIVIDVKKDARCDLILAYLYSKTSMKSSYTANMVAIVDGRPRTLTLIDIIDSYIKHQIEVITRRTTFDLKKSTSRLHIVEGLIFASQNINEVVEIIRSSKDKADSKQNLMKKYNLTVEQAEAIVMMPLYKLSHTDEDVLIKEKDTLIALIDELNSILEDPNKQNKIICKDLKYISAKYGHSRKTTIEEKKDIEPIKKIDLIRKEEVYFAISKSGYVKRSSIKSYSLSGKLPLPNLKPGDALVSSSRCYTTDHILAFTNLGNFLSFSVYELKETKFKDEGEHISSLVSFQNGNEKIIKAVVVSKFREDAYIVLLTKNGQIKKTMVSDFDVARTSKPVKCIRLLPGDEVSDVVLSTGWSNLAIFSSLGNISFIKETELSPLGLKASGVKSMIGLAKQKAVSLASLEPNINHKIALITNKGCLRIFNSDKLTLTPRLGKTFSSFKSFKSDVHSLVGINLITSKENGIPFAFYDNKGNVSNCEISDFKMTEIDRMAKKNIVELNKGSFITSLYFEGMDVCDESLVCKDIPPLKDQDSNSLIQKEDDSAIIEKADEQEENKKGTVEQISIFDDLDE